MISVSPDPAHPRGGYALLSLPESELNEDTTQVAVFDNYSERYLGEAGWQPTRVLFGPYQVIREGGEARLVIGPEIVNQIEEYANVKMIVGSSEQDVSWPDEVVPAPGAAKIGGIMGTTIKEAAPKGTLTAKIAEPEPTPDPEPEETVETLEQEVSEADAGNDEPAKSRIGAIVGLLLVVLVSAGVAFWLLSTEETPAVEPVAEPVTAPEPVAEAEDPCSIEALTALDGFPAQTEALRGCASNASADAALGLVERAAAANDPDALLLFGTIYDGQADADIIEDQIGLTFGDEPATAAEYYARAVAAGSESAAESLAILCERMATMSDTLVQGAVADYCGN